MQSVSWSMLDAILVRMDKMATHIEDLEKAMDNILHDVTSLDKQVILASPLRSPIKQAAVAPQSLDV
jgi:hypothetical protein